MANDTIKQKKRQADKAEAEALAKQGKKRDVNGITIDSPQQYLEKAAREAGPTFKPVAMTAGENGAYLKGSTSIGTLYNRTTLENGTEKVRTKTYRGGKKTKEEAFKLETAEDGTESYRRTGKKETMGNSTREVSYAKDGSKIVTKTNSRGTSTRKIDEDGKSEILHRKVSNLYERRYEINDKGEKELVAKRNGLSSQYTQFNDVDGSKLTKTKQLGGLVSKTVKITGDKDNPQEEVVAKRSFIKRLNIYDNDDGTKKTIERQKGWIKKTTEQNYVAGEKDGDDKIRETVTIKRLGGLFKSTTTNMRALNDDERKVQNQRALPGAEKAAGQSVGNLGQALKEFQGQPTNDANKTKLQLAQNEFLQKATAYHALKTGNKDGAGLEKTMVELATRAQREEILKNGDQGAITKEVEERALRAMILEKAAKDNQAKSPAMDRDEIAKRFTSAAKTYADYENARNPQAKALSVDDVKERFLAKAREENQLSVDNAVAKRTPSPNGVETQQNTKLQEYAAGTKDKQPAIDAFVAKLAQDAAQSRGLAERSRDAGRSGI